MSREFDALMQPTEKRSSTRVEVREIRVEMTLSHGTKWCPWSYIYDEAKEAVADIERHVDAKASTVVVVDREEVCSHCGLTPDYEGDEPSCCGVAVEEALAYMRAQAEQQHPITNLKIGKP